MERDLERPMQTIGERLEEARSRKGISTRDAAEATKIRGDFLLSFENNSMDIPLPEIYVRGFLKNYARFLEIETDTIMTDYDALRLGDSKSIKRENREFLGRMDLPQREEAVRQADEAVAPIEEKDAGERSLYLTMALVFSAIFALVFVIVVLVSKIVVSDKPALNPELAESESGQETFSIEGGGDHVTSVQEETFTLVALDDVTVIIEQRIDRKRLFSGTLAKDDQRTFSKSGPIKISFTAGENLIIEKNGQRFEMGTPGVGTRTLE